MDFELCLFGIEEFPMIVLLPLEMPIRVTV